MRRYFGTDGIRGRANVPPMTPDIAQRLGMALVEQFRGKHGKPRIVIGKDTRISGYLFEQAVASGICAMGGNVLLTGPLPTPGIAFITHSMRADAGVVISASHNAYPDNGIKIFDRNGYKLSDEVEEALERRIDDPKLLERAAQGADVGRAMKIADAVGRYVVALKSAFPRERTLDGMKVVVDCANGAAYKVAPLVFQELGAEVISLATSPNGLNINAGVGALHPDVVQQAVVEHGAHVGVCLDGDADRLILVDQTGAVVDGDRIMAIMAEILKEHGRLVEDTVVATTMSNLGLESWLEGRGMKMVRTDVGDRYVLAHMREKGLNFGGEQSGHLIFLDQSTTGDGVLAALMVLWAMGQTERPLSELPEGFRRYPQELVNVRVADKPTFDAIDGLPQVMRAFEREVGAKGRVVLRYSGTEPLARVMVEAEDEAVVKQWVTRIADHVRRAIGEEGAR